MPLHTASDGTSTVQLQLHPADLGQVQVTVTVHAGVVNVHLQAASGAGHTALSQSMNVLRLELESSGVATGTLTLADQGGQGAGQYQPGAQPTADASVTSPTQVDLTDEAPRTIASGTTLDLRM
jgi:flagellar hook-length control protein FliK